MIEQRKQAISIRLGGSDLRNVKRLAKRLGVRDSDIIRYAIKSMLGRIGPLCDERIVGRNLVPVLVESGEELIRHFDLDSYRLESIVNDQAADELRVERDDIALLAMHVLREQYLLMRMKEGGPNSESAVVSRSLRDYLYEKYIYRHQELSQGEFGAANVAEPRNGFERPAA